MEKINLDQIDFLLKRFKEGQEKIKELQEKVRQADLIGELKDQLRGEMRMEKLKNQFNIVIQPGLLQGYAGYCFELHINSFDSTIEGCRRKMYKAIEKELEMRRRGWQDHLPKGAWHEVVEIEQEIDTEEPKS